jgi:hypothetical protein
MPEFEAKMTASPPILFGLALHRRAGRILAQCLRLGENKMLLSGHLGSGLAGQFVSETVA